MSKHKLACTTMCFELNLPRQYEPIWTELKAFGKVSVTAPRPLHKRIIKAVKKEKWKDIGWKLKIEPRVAVLIHSRSGSILTFELTYPITRNL